MIEFGEQLRRAREAKGMTQQSLAEQLFVTRQAVSRWECGDRYPDLLTTKKISTILDISLDDLLSGKEMKKVVERNPIIESTLMNNIVLVLYAFIVFSFAITMVDIIFRFPMNSEAVDFSDIQLIIINILGLMIQIGVFTYGFIMTLKGKLSPKRTGAVLVGYFASLCLTESYRISIINYDRWQFVVLWFMMTLPNVLGVVATYQYFINNKLKKKWIVMIYAIDIWAMIRIIANNYIIITKTHEFVSTNTAIQMLLKLCIYFLIIYQTNLLFKKSKIIEK